LAKKWEMGKVDPTGWLMSEKLDGMRAYWDGANFVSRLGNAINCPPCLLFAELPRGFALDGELFLGRGRFQDLMSVIKNGASTAVDWEAVRYVVFDAPAVPGGFEARLAEADKRLKGLTYIHVHPHERCESVAHLEREQKKVEAMGGEGLMLRQAGSAYRTGRDNCLLKVKSFFDEEAEVIGHEPGKGKHTGALGALRCRSSTGKVFNLGTGFSDAQRRDPPKIGEIVTYRYQELTKDGIPRFPSYIGMRADADASAFRSSPARGSPVRVAPGSPARRSPPARGVVGARAPAAASVPRSGGASAAAASPPRSRGAGAVAAAERGAAATNDELADVFEEMATVHGIRGDRIRRQAYSKAADALRRESEAILCGDQARSIPGIGAGMARRIDEVLDTGELVELQELKLDPAVIAVKELRIVYGIGPKLAADLIGKQGITSLAQLREAVAAGRLALNPAQKVGMDLAEDLQVRIPRAEVMEIEAVLQEVGGKLAADMHLAAEELMVKICGSFRRGRADCGDVDVLLTSKPFRSEPTNPKGQHKEGGDLLRRFVELLRSTRILTHDLAFGPTKYMGVIRVHDLHRRLDIRCFPYDQFWYGLVYFTGPRLLSIDLRTRAIERGLVLNEYGLTSKENPHERVLVNSEREIFEALGAPYREPHER